MVVGKELEEFNKKLEAFLKYISENKLDGDSPKNKPITPDIARAIKNRITASKGDVTESISYSQAIKTARKYIFQHPLQTRVFNDNKICSITKSKVP